MTVALDREIETSSARTMVPGARIDLSKSILSTSGDLNQAKTTVRYGASRALLGTNTSDVTPKEKERQKYLSSSPVRRHYTHGETREIDDHNARKQEEDFLSTVLQRGCVEDEDEDKDEDARLKDIGVEDDIGSLQSMTGNDNVEVEAGQADTEAVVREEEEEERDADGDQDHNEEKEPLRRDEERENEHIASSTHQRENLDASLSALDLLDNQRDISKEQGKNESASTSSLRSTPVTSPAGKPKPPSPQMGLWLSTYVTASRVCI